MTTPGARKAPRPIALVRRGFSPTGGAEKFLQRFAAEAQRRGRRVFLVTDEPWPEIARQGLEQIVLPGRSVWSFAKSVERWRKNWDGLLFSFERLFSADCYRAGDGVYAAWMRRRSQYDPFIHVLLRKFSLKHFHLLELERRCFSAACTDAIENAAAAPASTACQQHARRPCPQLQALQEQVQAQATPCTRWRHMGSQRAFGAPTCPGAALCTACQH